MLAVMCGKFEKKITVERMSRGQSQRRTDSRKRVLERCESKGKTNDIIDVDSDRIPDFIIIDPPEPSESTPSESTSSDIRNRMSRKGKTSLYGNIICIDDDNGNDESGDCCCQNGLEEVGNQEPCSASNYHSHPASDQFHNSHTSSDESEKAHAAYNDVRKPSSNPSNHLGTSSGKISSLNQKKFTATASCGNDDTDCDVMEDYMGNIRQQWEEASLRKKKTFEIVPKGRSGSQDEFSATGFNTDSHNTDGANKTAEVPIPSSSGNANHERGNLSPSACTVEDVGDNSSKSDGETQYAGLEEIIQQGICNSASVCNNQALNNMASESMQCSQLSVKLSSPIPVSNGDGPNIQNHIYGDREMLKETDAYKRAEEEEWASRHRELQIQAEEAQRLRKRRKAETLRLLEMERRQKQRVEEVREAQKKDEQTLNLKEQLRLEVRRELDKLEANCRDMSSLLHGLGINVGGGLYPSSSEVRAAYKQALLRFHPDRASRSGIRQQIESEEKFKLVSRAKEKFML